MLCTRGSASAAPRPDLPPFRGQFQLARNLDLLVEMDEPMHLMIELERVARERMERAHDQWKTAWDAVAKHAVAAVRGIGDF